MNGSVLLASDCVNFDLMNATEVFLSRREMWKEVVIAKVAAMFRESCILWFSKAMVVMFHLVFN